MCGHPHDGLIWAPDPRDDLAFTMYAINEEVDDLKNEITHHLNTLNYPYQSVEDMINDLGVIFPDARHILNYHDWVDLYDNQFIRY